ncbi:hypothetical protein O181_079158 [Austropuccinia psidii MF-1]|uniref:Uncharacterized protein n=1 Tax=Austropuccinia psidii MF-1 TaxID=1389203 RepID=A0A9Q3FKD5_9BASI|nr:hypothetical protein [Austropuccinia psidii MF-1]
MPTLTLELASASPPNPLQHLACLRPCTPLQMRLQHCPHLCPHHSLCFCTPPHLLLGLQSLSSCGTLNLCLQCLPRPPLHLLAPCARGVPSQHFLNTAYHPYAQLLARSIAYSGLLAYMMNAIGEIC